MSLKIIGHVLLAVLTGASVTGCGGGAGGGAASPESQTASAIASLDESVLAGSVTDEEFASRLDEILATVDGRTNGVENLSLLSRTTSSAPTSWPGWWRVTGLLP